MSFSATAAPSPAAHLAVAGASLTAAGLAHGAALLDWAPAAAACLAFIHHRRSTSSHLAQDSSGRRARAIRVLPRGRWQVRRHGRWCPVVDVQFTQGLGWMHMQAAWHPDIPPTHDVAPSARGGRVRMTAWRHRMSPERWRTLCVAVRNHRAAPQQDDAS